MTVIENTLKSQELSSSRLSVYIDGFNLYHAIDALGDPLLKWLNFWQLSKSFLREGEVLSEVHLFTAVLKWNREKQQRHENFLAACRAVGVTVHEGNFRKAHKHCQEFSRNCKFQEEKQTDVAIAVKLVADAFSDRFDRAVLITADSDQIPTARLFKTLKQTLTLMYPPGRATTARDLGNEIPDRHEITEGRLRTCRLPRSVTDAAGRTVATMPGLYERRRG